MGGHMKPVSKQHMNFDSLLLSLAHTYMNHLSKSLAGTNWHRQTQFYSHFPWIASPWQGQKQTACVGRLASGLTGEGWHGAWLDG